MSPAANCSPAIEESPTGAGKTAAWLVEAATIIAKAPAIAASAQPARLFDIMFSLQIRPTAQTSMANLNDR
jgi:hypothetical protein